MVDLYSITYPTPHFMHEEAAKISEYLPNGQFKHAAIEVYPVKSLKVLNCVYSK